VSFLLHALKNKATKTRIKRLLIFKRAHFIE